MLRIVIFVLLTLSLMGQAALPGRAGTAAKVSLELIAEGLNAPIFLVEPPDGSGRRIIGEQMGLAYVLDAGGKLGKEPFLDLRQKIVPLLKAFDERGLLALAFHPDFAKNGLFYVNYSAKPRPDSPFKGKTAYTWRTSEFRIDANNANRADPASERVLLQLDWVNRKHNGGGLAFGPDGYLYIGVGDGGGAHGVPDVHIPAKIDENDKFRHSKKISEDPFKVPKKFHHYDRYAQDTKRLNGKILRIDVNRGHPGYGIPATNLFKGKAEGRDEIYAWGFRNPFRISFDRIGNGDIFVSGVAESFWETVYLVQRQGNYGWATRERAFDPPKDCPRHGPLGARIHDPIIEYANWSVKRPWSKVHVEPMGTANIGGFLYRGKAIPELYGRFVFGDFSSIIQKPSGQLFAATPAPQWGALWSIARLRQLDVRLHSLSEDGNGELYLLTTAYGIPVGNTGKVWKLVPYKAP